MSFAAFKAKVDALIAKAGGEINVIYSEGDGKFTARCSDGTTITGNPSCLRVEVRWGSGHCSLATI